MSRSRWRLLALVVVLLLAAGLRLYRLDAQSLWYDEGASLGYAARTPRQIWRNTAADIHPPGYYVALAGWTRLTGFSELALRGLSALFGVLLVAQVCALGRALFNPDVGLLAAALIAIDPFHIYYSQEARMYALLAWLSAASLWFFLRWLDEERPRRAWLSLSGLALVNTAALYTHYIFPFFIAAETLLLLAWWLWETPRGQSRRLSRLATWAALQAVTLLLYLPWLPTALRHVSGFPRVQVALAPAEALLGMGSLLAYGVTLPASSGAAGLVPLGLLAAVGLFPPLESGRATPSHGWRVGLVLGWLLIPTAAMFAFKLYQGGYLRFVLPADAALSLLVARGVWMGLRITQPGVPGAGRSGWLALLVVALAALGLAPTLESLSNLYFEPAYARDDYRGLARHLQEVAGPDDAIILNGPNQWEVFTYYYPPGPAIHPLPSDNTQAELGGILAGARRVYAVFYGENERDPQRVVEGTLDKHAFEAETRWYGDVRLVTYGVSDAPLEEPAVRLEAVFGEHVHLLGYTLEAYDARPGGLLNVALFWQTDAPLEESYSVFVHLRGEGEGAPLAQHDGVPGGGLLFTNTWTPGQTVRDLHGVLIPPDIPPGEYSLVVGMYEPESGQRLPVASDQQGTADWLPLSSLTVQ